ncbi:MAG: hypothetical protein H7A24_04525 [Leptospiraceae bacterium]|nr:hypothetical protein [Leptospiraceae bacterium]MCP5511121.1 hypothetical protein [Leptospiraceae bacterium]
MKKFYAILLLLSLSNCVVSNYLYLRTKNDLAEKYKSGKELYSKKQYRDSLLTFQDIISVDPEYQDVDKYIAKIEYTINQNTKKYYEKGQYFEKKSSPIDAILNYRICLSYSPDSKYLDADTRIGSLLKDGKVIEHFDTKFKLIDSLIEKKKLNDALVQVNKLMEIDPNNQKVIAQKQTLDSSLLAEATPHFQEGEKQLQASNYAAASKSYQKALSIYPDYEDARKQLSVSNLNAYNYRHYQNATSALKANKPLDCITHINNIRGSYKDSSRVMSQCKSAVESDFNTYFSRAVGLYENQKLKECIPIFNLLLIVSPNDDQSKKYKELAEKKLATLESLE